MKRLVFISVALLLSFGCAAPDRKAAPVNPLVARGLEYLAKGSQRLDRGCFRDAAQDFTLAYQDFQASDNLPGMASALNNLAVSHLNLGEDQKAELFAKRALAINRNLGDSPGQAANLTVLGGVQLSRGEEGAALGFLEQALKNADAVPASLRARIHNAIAVALMRAGKTGDAKAHLETALGLAPGSSAVQLNMGRVEMSLSGPIAAEERYKKALDIDRKEGYTPGIAADLTELGLLYLETEKSAQAAEHLARALALWELLGQENRADELREVLERAGLEVVRPAAREDDEEWPPPACR